MKRIAIALLVTAAALAANSARANTNVSIGVRFGTPVYAPPAPAVVVAPAPNYCPPAPAPVVYAPAGYWKDVSVKTWVPERFVMSRDRWGRPVRVCEPGHYAFTTERVWVDGRHDNRYDNRYGYDNRNGWNR